MSKDLLSGSTDFKQLKFWIKEGLSVAHKSNPYREMTVDRILRKDKECKDKDGNVVIKKWVMGVECHWVDDTGKYNKGRFFTHELVPYKDKF